MEGVRLVGAQEKGHDSACPSKRELQLACAAVVVASDALKISFPFSAAT
jgi:hypothetical protein